MDIATIQAVGEYIVTPLCAVGALVAFLYFMTR